MPPKINTDDFKHSFKYNSLGKKNSHSCYYIVKNKNAEFLMQKKLAWVDLVHCKVNGKFLEDVSVLDKIDKFEDISIIDEVDSDETFKLYHIGEKQSQLSGIYPTPIITPGIDQGFHVGRELSKLTCLKLKVGSVKEFLEIYLNPFPNSLTVTNSQTYYIRDLGPEFEAPPLIPKQISDKLDLKLWAFHKQGLGVSSSTLFAIQKYTEILTHLSVPPVGRPVGAYDISFDKEGGHLIKGDWNIYSGQYGQVKKFVFNNWQRVVKNPYVITN